MIISYDNIVGKQFLDFLSGLTVLPLVTGLSSILIITLLQELKVFPYRLHVYCTSMGIL